jgi:hypothetical protein
VTACGSGDVCTAGACSAPPSCAQNGSACDDGNPCTIDDTCASSVCTGAPKCTSAPANAMPTCGTDGTCDFACDAGYARSGSACVAPEKQIFITSQTWTGNFGKLAGGDAKCQAAATAAGLTGTFMAWLSDSTTSASMRLSHATVPYVMTDGTVIATSWSTLTNGTIAHPIDVTETGTTLTSHIMVWTGTSELDGATLIVDGSCSSWTSSAGDTSNLNDYGDGGDSGDADATWTDNGGGLCSEPEALYCLEQ